MPVRHGHALGMPAGVQSLLTEVNHLQLLSAFMVQDMTSPLKYRDKCHQGESKHQNHDSDGDRTTDVGGPGILLLIVQGCPILPKGDPLKPGEPTRPLLILFARGREGVGL